MNQAQRIWIFAGIVLLVAVVVAFANHGLAAIAAGDSTVVNLVMIPLLVAPIYAIIFFAVGLIFGAIALRLLDRAGLAANVGALSGTGLLIGVAAGLIISALLGVDPVDLLEFGLLGGLSGSTIAIIWWLAVERKVANA